jgi:hypothetical protein
MGWSYRKSVRAGKGRRVNVSKSGASISQTVGPVTVNTRGRFSIRLFKGLSYRGGCAVALVIPIAMALALAIAATTL